MSYSEFHDLGRPGARLQVTIDIDKRELRFQPVEMCGNNIVNKMKDRLQIVVLPKNPKDTKPEISKWIRLFREEFACICLQHGLDLSYDQRRMMNSYGVESGIDVFSASEKVLFQLFVAHAKWDCG